MPKLAWLVLILALAGVLWLEFRPQRAREVGADPVAVPPAADLVEAGRGRRAEQPSEGMIAAARRTMGDDLRRASCGPYQLYTDSPEPWPAEGCARIGTALDDVYRERYGVEPRGEPAGAILLFRELDEYRGFVREATPLRTGYAGFSDAARGIVALHLEGQAADEVMSTLAHELAHLAHRRAFGPNLPAWLSEGLADGIGDPAGIDGLRPARGVEGAETATRRLAGALELGRARSIEELATLDRSGFDRGVVSFDYESSALLIRFLLVDPELRAGFRSFLSRLTREPYRPQQLPASLGIGWGELERRFHSWLERQTMASAGSDRPPKGD